MKNKQDIKKYYSVYKHPHRRKRYILTALAQLFIRILIVGILLTVFVRNIYAGDIDIPDSTITYAIESDFNWGKGISSHLIDIDTKDGIVTLSGFVNNILSRERALEIAESIKGVRSVINRIAIRPISRTDNDIKSDILYLFSLDPIIKHFDLKIDVDDGIVTVNGTATSWVEKKRVIRIIKNIVGIRSIMEKIKISSVNNRSDEKIKKEIQYSFKWDPYLFLRDELINVNVENGHVALEGTVGSASEKRFAYNDALITGVKSVDTSELIVKLWAKDWIRQKKQKVTLLDKEIKKAVQDAFYNDPRIYDNKIILSVINGSVTLRGSVPTLIAKRAAEADTRNTKGVNSVVNRIKVRPGELPDDSTINKYIQSRMKKNPIIERYEVRTVVRNGKVYLYGFIDSYYEKQYIEDVISQVYGVIDVKNSLTVNASWAWKGDKKIKVDIEKEIALCSCLEGNAISVQVQGATAILTGNVQSWRHLNLAVENAFDGGALKVVSHLAIQGGPKNHSLHTYNDRYLWWK